ncbi:acyltransferase [Riemerella anatipestifer]|nr:acyltransferase [Riemerella anatipestifer]
MTGREQFNRNKKIILFCIRIVSLLPMFIRKFIWDWSSRYSQVIFVAIRYIILKSMIKQCGDNVKVGTNVQILGWEKLVMGSNVSIHSNCYIDAHGGIIIADNVSIAHNTTVLSTNHTWGDLNIPIKYNELHCNPVQVQSDVWIGCGVRILAGVTIESRSIVAAGAVVNANVLSHSIVGGVPAKKIKQI